MVASGQFIGCVSRLALQQSFAAGSLVELAVPRLDLHRRFYLVTNRRKYRTPGIEGFFTICREIQKR